MDTKGKGVAWICIFSTLLTGCYTSTLIDTNGEAKERIYSDAIVDLITKEGRKYVFNTPPVIRNDTLVGEATIDYGYFVKRQVVIPLTEVSCVSVAEYSSLLTVVAIVALVGCAGLFVLGLTWGGYTTPFL